MSLQQFSASLLKAEQQTNIGLITNSFDFSLVKVEPPKEFSSIGNEISPSRRKSAEEGRPHITARKLGALFQHWLPRTPHLIRAYGSRASEIAAKPEVNPKASRSDDTSIFADHMGIDGTSVWAAATSGPDAIAVHLLACMLARIWSPAQATAIWVELVTSRQRELESVENTDPLFQISHALSRISVTRDQLREWDNSARAWIRAADEAMRLKQTQLMLVVNNVSLPINAHPKLFENVLQSWKSAMTAADSLIQGMPQSVENASILLGLCAWHLYPDMLVLQSSPTPIRQDDPLVNQGGILTIGLQIQRTDHYGVYWSLPLGHLRYYGSPAQTEALLGDRISTTQLIQVAYGSLSRGWCYSRKELAMFMVLVWDAVKHAAEVSALGADHWLGIISEAVWPMVRGDEIPRKQCEQLMRLGAKRCHSFICPQEHIPPLFGLTEIENVLDILKPEDAINYLRRYVESVADRQRVYVIRYDSEQWVEFASALPVVDPQDQEGVSQKYARWLDRYPTDPRYQTVRDQGEIAFEVHESDINWEGLLHRPIFWANPPSIFENHSRLVVEKNGTRYAQVDLTRIAGHVDSAVSSVSLWATGKRLSKQNVHFRGESSLSFLFNILRNGSVKRYNLLQYLTSWIHDDHRASLRVSLQALATVKALYNTIPNARISLEVTSETMHSMTWIPVVEGVRRKRPRFRGKDHSIDRFSPFRLNRSQMFSCIALFESGKYNVSPSSLRDVMAMAAGDSIYISERLVKDPSIVPAPSAIRRISGSIGKPGIALLIPVKNPKMPSFNKGDWHIVNHDPFQGASEDSFLGTTLHLWFTEYVLPIDTGVHGLQDSDIYFQESVISVHDRGKWVADLDILGKFDDDLIYRVLPQSCEHDVSTTSSILPNSRITAIDNFSELLDAPEYVGVVRSSGNWLGRLATATLSMQLAHPTIIIPQHLCWDCIVESWLGLRIDINHLDKGADKRPLKGQGKRPFKRRRESSPESETGLTEASGSLASEEWGLDEVDAQLLRRTTSKISPPRSQANHFVAMSVDSKIADMAGMILIC